MHFSLPSIGSLEDIVSRFSWIMVFVLVCFELTGGHEVPNSGEIVVNARASFEVVRCLQYYRYIPLIRLDFHNKITQ